MGQDSSPPTGPDFTQGTPLAGIADGGMVAGHVGGEAVLLVARGGDVFAVAATCTHYGGPLAEGLVVGETIRCPWHHACFNLRTGRPHAPALDDLKRWRVETRDGHAFVREELPEHRAPELATPALPASIVVIGGGAAGNAAVETLRREGYQGPLKVGRAACRGSVGP